MKIYLTKLVEYSWFGAVGIIAIGIAGACCLAVKRLITEGNLNHIKQHA